MLANLIASPFAFRGLLEFARLHDGGMQVKIVRHNRRADDADADVKHLLIRDDVRPRHESEHHADEAGFGKDQFSGEASGDGRDERDDQRLDVTKALLLEVKNGQHIERGNAATPHQRNTEEKLQGDGRADDFGQIARGNGDFAKNPKKPNCRRRVMIAAGLREIASRGDAELDAQMLKQDRHEIGEHDDKQQRVAKFRAACQVGRPIAGVHVTDRDEKAGPGESEQLSPK